MPRHLPDDDSPATLCGLALDQLPDGDTIITDIFESTDCEGCIAMVQVQPSRGRTLDLEVGIDPAFRQTLETLTGAVHEHATNQVAEMRELRAELAELRAEIAPLKSHVSTLTIVLWHIMTKQAQLPAESRTHLNNLIARYLREGVPVAPVITVSEVDDRIWEFDVQADEPNEDPEPRSAWERIGEDDS